MQELMLVPPRAPAARARSALSSSDLAAVGAGAIGVGLATFGPAALVLASVLGAAGAGIHALRRASRDPLASPIEPEVMPIAIESPDLRAAYVRMLTTHESVRHSLLAAPDARDAVDHLFGQARAIIHHGGRLALGTNALHRYLELHPGDAIDAEIRLLEDQVAAAADRETAVAYGHALVARRRQAEARRSMATMCDRIRARIEMATASLAMLGAIAIEVGGMQVARATLDAEALTERAEELASDLRVLESVLGEAA